MAALCSDLTLKSSATCYRFDCEMLLHLWSTAKLDM
ncbi:hypothetical protein ACVWWI_006657 [Bradyrhizobium sp. USDA 3686]|nr:hypothetical protein [Bradyrhizobium canariense]